MINTNNRIIEKGSLSNSHDLDILKMGEVINQRYEIIEKIGSGGFGIVYKVKDIKLNSIVAIKVFHKNVFKNKKYLIRLQREINISRKIKDHSNLLKIHSLEESENIIFLVMEFIEGISLEKHLKGKKLQWEEFKPLFFQILKGVKELHTNGIIHRDLKPSNIMIYEDRIKLLDFGLSKELDDTEKTSSIGEIVGSPDYMSPEQVTNEELDFRSDIYQLGIILYKTLSGFLPFTKETTTMSLIFKRINSKPKELKKSGIYLPKFLDFGIFKALEKSREDRFESIRDVEEYFKDEHYPFLGRTIQGIKKKPKTTVFTVLLLILISFFSYVFIKDNNEIDRVQYNGSNLKVYNPFGIKLFEKNFKDKVIQYAAKQFLSRIDSGANKQLNPQNTVLTFLEPKSKIVYPDFQSYLYNSDYISASLYDRGGDHIYDLSVNTNLYTNLFYDFSKSFRFKLSERIPVYNSNETVLAFILTHYYGMFPTSIHFIHKNGKKSHFYNPGQFLYYKVKREINNSKVIEVSLFNSLDQKYEYRFILYGRNNIMSHLNFFAETSHIKGQHYFIPNLFRNHQGNKKEFLVFLPFPIYILKDEWFSKDYIEFHDRINKSIINVSKNNITIKTGNKTLIYRDEKEKLDIIYDSINSYYKEKMLNKNYHKGISYLDKALKMKPENPWLHSALLNLSGDLNIRNGDFERGLNSLNKSLELYSDNIDSFQRICEVNFLLNKEEELNVLFDNNKKDRYLFFGLSNGLEIFKIYTWLHFGKFFKAEKIIDKIVLFYENIANRNNVNGNPLLKVIYDIFTGDYKEAVSISESLRGKNLSPFTLNEYRLFYSRSAILSSIYDEEKPKKIIMRLTRFYIDDISKNSITLNHQADISRAYFFAKDGELDKAKILLVSGYKELLKMNKGDFFTRLWFFYDMFMYGKTNELLGNYKEAIRGYEESIKANPHTDLAKRAENIIEKLTTKDTKGTKKNLTTDYAD